MMDFLNNNLTAIIIAVIGVVGISLVISIKVRKNKNNNNRVNQKGNVVGGNMSGRDTITNKEDGK